MEYVVLAYYVFTPITDPEGEARRHKNFLQTLDSRGRIYIGKDGVNAQLSLAEGDLEAYQAWLSTDSRYSEADIKVHRWHEHPFAKLTVKMREKLVAIDRDIDLSKRGEYLTPAQWKASLDERDESTIVVDVRNNYESDVGHFEGALRPDLDNFRQFDQYAKDLAQTYDTKKTKVMMYCTGGIRCELYSAVLKEEGFDTVHQLKGGVIRYGIEEGSEHWRGKLFVFDDRLVVPISGDNEETISRCHSCGGAADAYYNCANMDCNDLFVSCPECAENKKGCCSQKCLSEGRVRPFASMPHPKPFRKLSKEEKLQLRAVETEVKGS